jgi:hypothetical protein
MSKSHFVYENPFLSVVIGLIASLIFISVSIQYGIAVIPSQVYQLMKLFLVFNHTMNALEWCELHLFSRLVAQSAAIALFVNIGIFCAFIIQLSFFTRHRETIRISQHKDALSVIFLDLWNWGNQYFRVLRAIVLFLLGWYMASAFLQLNHRPVDFENLNCSALGAHNMYKILIYPFVAAASCYCFIRSIKDVIQVLVGFSDRLNARK